MLLLLLHSLDRSPFTCDLGGLRNTLVIYNEDGAQLVECHFDIWDSDDLKFGVDGLDKNCRFPVWTRISIFYPSLLEIPIDLDIFGQFPKRQFSFSLQHESIINISKDNLHLSECFSWHQSCFTPFL